MNKAFKIPPKTPQKLSSLKTLKERLAPLIGTVFKLTVKSRTDGSNVRKLIAKTLEQYSLPEPVLDEEYEIVPPKKKGIPKITREFVDTYIVTSGKSYNLQVWNRIPSSDTLLIKYDSGESLKCTDVRFVFAKVDMEQSKIACIIIATPDYLVKQFGKFGRPTIKHQLLISTRIRKSIYKSEDKILFFRDSKKLSYLITHDFEAPQNDMVKEARANEVFSLELIKKTVAEKLIGFKLAADSTQKRGQALERKVLEFLGYSAADEDLLYGAFPDIPNQLLEIKIQDTQKVDLGKFTPVTTP